MEAGRDELRRLVDELPDQQVQRALDDIRALLAKRQAGAWPPAWFGIAEGARPDTARRVDELLAEGFGRS